MRFRCPKCKSERFEIQAEQWITTNVDSKGDIQSTDKPGHIQWNNESAISCSQCGETGLVEEFTTVGCDEEESEG